uniref:PIN-like domain-containing protein n=1 Tax=Novosphingobium aromaticivorans TaxID=48935 RepID=UPI0002E959A1|nr:PIN-like domain-containing protein [Novosphingobium aromaticivorans]
MTAGRSREHQINSAAPLKIPFEKDTVEGYIASLDALIRAPGTHVYVDTSFLVWLTALGCEARNEFTGWLRAVAAGRVHVPVWAAHEYLRHHMGNLHGKKLKGIETALNDLANNTFNDLRPYIDTSFTGDSRSPAEIIAATRSVLIDVKRVAAIAGRWTKQHYDSNSKAIIEFINECGLPSAPMLDWMGDIQSVEEARFEGRIPPGFQDRNKSGANGGGANSFGDLMFWKEILHHAGQRRARGVVVISNDGKNDWVMGGLDQPDLDAELKVIASKLPPIPRPQPMLEYEAKASAGVQELMLVDRKYLAIYLRRTGVPSDRFFGSAIDVTLPSPDREDEAIRKQARDQATGRTSVASGIEPQRDTPKHLPVDDASGIADNPLALRLAFSASSSDANEKSGPLLDHMLANDAEGLGLDAFLTKEALANWDGRAAVWFGRSLGTRSIEGNALATTYTTDLLGVFERLPPRTATNLYLGLLASAYVDGSSLKTIPRTPWLPRLLALQGQPRAKGAIDAFRNIVADWPGRPVYLPDADRPALSVKPLLAKATGTAPRLTGLQIGGIGVIVEAQEDAGLRLANRFPGVTTVVLGDVVKDVCNALGIPFDQLMAHEAFEREVAFGSTVGIAAEGDLRNSMEDQS